MSPIRPGGSWRAWCLKGPVTRPRGFNQLPGAQRWWFHLRNWVISQQHGWFSQENLLSSSDPYPETLFWHSLWHTIWKYIWHIYSDILSDILSGIYFDLSIVLSGIYSDILSYILTFFLASIWNLSWHSIRHSFQAFILWPSFWHLSWHSLWHSFWYSIWHSLFRLAEVWQCPRRSRAGGWGPAVPTAIWRLRLRSGSAHWDLELAVEGLQPAEIWSSRLMSRRKGGGGSNW